MIAKRVVPLAIAGLLSSAGVGAVQAQRPEPSERGFCWWKTDSGCNWIVLSEMGYARNLVRNSRVAIADSTQTFPTFSRTDFGAADGYFHWQLGVLKRVTDQISAGGTFQLRSTGVGGHTWVQARGRYWLQPELGLDVSVGYKGQTQSLISGGFTTSVGLSVDDLVLLTATYDDFGWRDIEASAFPTPQYRDDVRRARGLHLGLSAGSGMGGIATTASAIGFVVLMGIYIVALGGGS
jgi:hypothetical protein